MNKKKKIKVLWVHSFNSNIIASGVFMNQLYNGLNSFEDIEIDLFETGTINHKSFYSILKRLKRKSVAYDIIHAQYGSGCGFITSLVAGRKLITLRGTDWYQYFGDNLKQKIKGYLIQFLTRNCLRRFNNIITVSKRMTDAVKQEYSQKNIVTIPDGVDLKKFYPIQRETARSEMNTNDINPWVLFSSVTDKNPVKRFRLAQEAFSLAKAKMPELQMKYMHGIEHAKVPLFINASNVILLTSTHEGWPNIIKEGLACNIPFVSTDVSDLKNISKATTNCFVCPDSAKTLADKIITSVKNNKDNNNLRKFMSNMEINVIATQIRNVYIQIISNENIHIV